MVWKGYSRFVDEVLICLLIILTVFTYNYGTSLNVLSLQSILIDKNMQDVLLFFRLIIDCILHLKVFVRELISNASDAVERLRFLETSGNVKGSDSPLEIHITTDEGGHTLTISDNGIGMTAEEMEKNLGTIAKSGSREYVAQLNQNNASGQESSNIIGQFGVGFYAAFMVADKVNKSLSPFLIV